MFYCQIPLQEYLYHAVSRKMLYLSLKRAKKKTLKWDKIHIFIFYFKNPFGRDREYILRFIDGFFFFFSQRLIDGVCFLWKLMNVCYRVLRSPACSIVSYLCKNIFGHAYGEDQKSLSKKNVVFEEPTSKLRLDSGFV